MEEKPKLCPFCGKTPELYPNGNVRCKTIDCPAFLGQAAPLSAWNRRTPGPATAGVNPQLLAAARYFYVLACEADTDRRETDGDRWRAHFGVIAEHEPAEPEVKP